MDIRGYWITVNNLIETVHPIRLSQQFDILMNILLYLKPMSMEVWRHLVTNVQRKFCPSESSRFVLEKWEWIAYCETFTL